MFLVFAFVAFVGSVGTSSSVASSVAGSCTGILSKFFIGKNLLLKLQNFFSYSK